MKRFFLFVMLAGVALSSCSKDSNSTSGNDNDAKVFAELQSEAATKTSITADGKVVWNPRDAIKIFNNNRHGRFVSTNTAPAVRVTFDGHLTIGKGTVYGLYPYSYYATCTSDGVFTTALPSEQMAVAGTFADELLITIGRSDDPSLIGQSSGIAIPFYNVCSGLRFKVTQRGIKKVVLATIGGESIAGEFKVAFGKDGKPEVKEIIDGKSSITLYAPDYGSFTPETWYYIITLPAHFSASSGLTATLYTDCNEGVRVRLGDVELQRAQFRQSFTLDEGLNLQDCNISFKDPLVKCICVAYWDKNGDGELSYKEAAAVRSLGCAFYGTRIRWFDELKYFTSLRRLGRGAFKCCGSLMSITIPDNVTDIEDECFTYCCSLRCITIPRNVERIGKYCFAGNRITVKMERKTPPRVYGGYFYTFPHYTRIVVPHDALRAYRRAWGHAWRIAVYR